MDLISCGFEELLKCGCAVCCPLYRSCKIHSNLSACICNESFPHLLQTALEILFLNSFHFVLQLPETRQLVRLRHFAHGTTALVFLTALSGKAVSYHCPVHGLLFSALFSFWPGEDCKKNNTVFSGKSHSFQCAYIQDLPLLGSSEQAEMCRTACVLLCDLWICFPEKFSIRLCSCVRLHLRAVPGVPSVPRPAALFSALELQVPLWQGWTLALCTIPSPKWGNAGSQTTFSPSPPH